MAEPLQDPIVVKLVSGVTGAVVSMKFLPGLSWPEKIIMVLGGSALSYYAATPAAEWLGAARAEGLVGFLIGIFGMAIVAKVYEVIQIMDAKTIAADVWEWASRKWRA
jgi:hypothetical protein